MEKMPKANTPEEWNADDERVENQAVEARHGMHVEMTPGAAKEKAYDMGLADDGSMPEAGPVSVYPATGEERKKPTAPSVESEASLGDQAGEATTA